MCCRLEDLRNKQVICIKDGNILGYVGDVEVDTLCGKLVSIIVFGKPKFFGLFGREDDIVIPWCEIEIIGNETILVNSVINRPIKRKRKISNIFYTN